MVKNINEELRNNFLVYAKQVNTNRAFPDVKDGLKVSQRAVLWEMYNKGYFYAKPHVKSAKVDGGVIANWHPHGSEYLTIVRMSQPWVNNICQIDFHGSNGSLLGGPQAAASRYTQCRLSKASEAGLFTAIKKDTVPFILNFSEDEEWPAVFPAIFPRLFVNGSQGIGYTIAQEWEPGNLYEFYEKVKEYTKTGKLSFDNIYPDYPTGGIIVNKDSISEIYKTGKGQVILRGKAEILGNFIQITELPYQVYAEPLIQKIKDLVNAGTLTGIEDICNKSDDTGLLIEIECVQDPQKVLTMLYKLTDLQTTFNANQMALINGEPKLFTLEQYLNTYIQHNINCLKREYSWELARAEKRKELVDGLVRAVSIVDDIIALIKSSKETSEAKAKLISTFGFTANQAEAITDLKLGKLAGLQIAKLNKELQELVKIIQNCNNLLNSIAAQKKEFLKRLKSFVDEFGYTRRTQVQQIDFDAQKAAAKPAAKQKADQMFVVVLSKANTIKRIAANNYRPIKKPISDSDIQLASVTVSSKARVVLISNKGTMYKLPVNKIPTCLSASAGMPLKDLFNQPIIALYQGFQNQAYKYLFFLTKRGLAKKIESQTVFSLSKLAGAPIMRVNDDDEIILSKLVNSDTITVAYGKKTKTLNTDNFLAKGRSAGGVVAIKTKQAITIV